MSGKLLRKVLEALEEEGVSNDCYFSIFSAFDFDEFETAIEGLHTATYLYNAWLELRQ